MNPRRRFLRATFCAFLAAVGGVPRGWAQPSAGGEKVHVVARGETLSSIAARHGVTVAALRTRNGIKDDRILAGQRLVIPGNPLLAEVEAATASLRITRGRWRHVVAHHSGIEVGAARAYDAAHRRRGMVNGLAYHFVIGNGRDSPEGAIEIGPRWLEQNDGGHVRTAAYNAHGIGVCLVGNFELRRPSAKQVESFIALVDWLRDTAPLGARPTFTVHRWVDRNHTVCPGRYFPYTRLRLRYG